MSADQGGVWVHHRRLGCVDRVIGSVVAGQ
jgi:hypothetical protein